MRQKALLLSLAIFLGLAVARADDDAELPKKRAAAIEKGIEWLKKTQAKDGTWDDTYQPFTGLGDHMKLGTTALSALALLKGGVAPDDPCIKKAFEWMGAARLDRTYSVGCLLMALEARFNWEPPQLDDGPGATVEKKDKKAVKLSDADIALAQRCVRFLTQNQARRGWNYPPRANGFNEDLSNTQYALLGLDAAERLGIEVPKDSYERAQDYLVSNQEKDGPDVDTFAVPGADLSYKELKKIEKDLKDAVKKTEGAFKGKKAGDTNAQGHTEEDEKRQAEGDAAKKIFKTVSSKDRMKARGWRYAYDRDKVGSLPELDNNVSGSMTTAGLACLFICKTHLDGTANYESKLKGPMDQALKDGAAWMAKNFTIEKNPNGSMHHLYYLYGLERAGVLLLVSKFGDHDWYREGTKYLLAAQSGEGSWDAGGNGTVGPTCDTCFALLFLARGTTQIVRIPTRTATGESPKAADPPKPGK